MNKFVIILLTVISLSLAGIFLMSSNGMVEVPPVPTPTSEPEIDSPKIAWAEEDYFFWADSYGSSLSHLDVPDQNKVYPNRVPKVGDVVAILCNRSDCHSPMFVKQVMKIEGDCYWLEGRKGTWIEDGIEVESVDSRTQYGWLCGDDIAIRGVVE